MSDPSLWCLEADLGENEARQVVIEDINAEDPLIVLDRMTDLVEFQCLQSGEHRVFTR